MILLTPKAPGRRPACLDTRQESQMSADDGRSEVRFL